jgi:Rod binding domain-containing protein
VTPLTSASLPPAPPGIDEERIARIRAMPAGAARRAAATELETVFMGQLLAALRKTVPESDYLPASPSRQVYEGAFDRAVAESLAARDPLGLVRLMGGEG